MGPYMAMWRAYITDFDMWGYQLHKFIFKKNKANV